MHPDCPGWRCGRSPSEQEPRECSCREFGQFSESEQAESSFAAQSLDPTTVATGARPEKLIDPKRVQSDREKPLSELAIRQRSAGDLDGALPGMKRTPVSKSDDKGPRSRLPTGRRADESSADTVRSAVAAARRQRIEGDSVGANSTIQQALQQMRDAEDLLPLKLDSSAQQEVTAARGKRRRDCETPPFGSVTPTIFLRPSEVWTAQWPWRRTAADLQRLRT